MLKSHHSGEQMRSILLHNRTDRLYYSPKIQEQIKKAAQNTVNPCFKKSGQKERSSQYKGISSHQKISKSSLPKHQNFGKIYPSKGNCTSNNVSLKSHGSNNGLPQRSEAHVRSQANLKPSNHKEYLNNTKQRQNIQIKSQYYQSSIIDKQLIRAKEIEKWQANQKGKQASYLRKIEEITFSMDSTEPEADEQQIRNDYDLPYRKTNTPQVQIPPEKGKSQFLNGFRKKIIEKEIIEKEKIYRTFIRSESKSSNQQERGKMKSRMKNVLNEIYELKKLIR